MQLDGVKTLFPGYFAFVMATGIISVASKQQSLTALAVALFWIAVVGYVVLSVLITARVALFPKAVFANLRNHATSFAFLTQVAGTNVLGSSAGIVMGWWGLSKILWLISLPLWVIWLYSALICEITSEHKPDVGTGINGTWFMLTVSTASIAVLGALLLPRWDASLVAFFSLAAFCLGIVIYVIVMTLVFMRWSFQDMDPAELVPPEWIATGAMAISTLAGANLVLAAGEQELLSALLPFLKGMTVLAWAVASFWFPLLVALGVWRHVVKKFPLTYMPALWSMVFPIGMYSASSNQMLKALDVSGLSWLPRIVLAMALLAWVATFVGMLGSFVPERSAARISAPDRADR